MTFRNATSVSLCPTSKDVVFVHLLNWKPKRNTTFLPNLRLNYNTLIGISTKHDDAIKKMKELVYENFGNVHIAPSLIQRFEEIFDECSGEIREKERIRFPETEDYR